MKYFVTDIYMYDFYFLTVATNQLAFVWNWNHNVLDCKEWITILLLELWMIHWVVTVQRFVLFIKTKFVCFNKSLFKSVFYFFNNVLFFLPLKPQVLVINEIFCKLYLLKFKKYIIKGRNNRHFNYVSLTVKSIFNA